MSGLEHLLQRRRSLHAAADLPDGAQPPAPALAERASPLLTAVREHLLRSGQSLGADETQARDRVWSALEEEYTAGYRHLCLSHPEKAALVDGLLQHVFGLGRIDHLVNDPQIKEIMINGPGVVLVERGGAPEPALQEDGQPLVFTDEAELLHLIERIVSRVHRKVDESTPIADARLFNGARVNVVLPPVSLVGPVVTIRKFPPSPLPLEDLIRSGALTPPAADFLDRLIQARCNLVVSGGTSTGKTTFLNALAMRIPPRERIITIEDSAEMQIPGLPNLVRMEARPANVEGKGAISIRDLVRTALRMRPDRIIVGECRSGEALDMLQAMNTGHDGSLTTVHANSARDALHRIETMVLMAGLELPAAAIRQQMAAAVDCIIHLARLVDGSRRVLEVLEVGQYAAGEVQTQALFRYDPGSGALQPTGLSPVRTDKFALAGVPLPDPGGGRRG